MNKKTFFSLLILFTLGALSVGAFITSKNIMGNDTTVQPENQGDEQVSLKELVITETKDGKKFWEIYADSGNYNNGNNIAILQNIISNFYLEDKVVLSVSSPKAEYNYNTKAVKLFGGAKAANDKNVYITADQITWAGSKNKISALGNVKIIKQDDGLMTVSQKASFDTDFSGLELSGDANTYVYPSVYGNLKE